MVFNPKFDDLKFSKSKMLRSRSVEDSIRNPWPFESSKTEVGRLSYGLRKLVGKSRKTKEFGGSEISSNLEGAKMYLAGAKFKWSCFAPNVARSEIRKGFLEKGVL